MNERPSLDKNLDSKTFRDFYYLKEELARFCRENGIPASGGKTELAGRIAHFLDTGKALHAPAARKKAAALSAISEDTKIEAGFVCSERHRAFFKEHIGRGFSFNVAFQAWLKANAGKTYREAIAAYHQILGEKKKSCTKIGRQFEYNAYVRDFFADNPGKSLADAIACWKHKKRRQGHNRYERADLVALDANAEERLMTLEYQKATFDDIDEIMSLVRNAMDVMTRHGIFQWDDLYPAKEDFQKDVEQEQLYVGTADGRIAVVYALNQECAEEYENGDWKYNEPFYVVHRLCVNPEFQNKGIAKRTLLHIETHLKSQGISVIRLDVFQENPFAVKLYDSLGYEKVGHIDWRMGRLILMEKKF